MPYNRPSSKISDLQILIGVLVGSFALLLGWMLMFHPDWLS